MNRTTMVPYLPMATILLAAASVAAAPAGRLVAPLLAEGPGADGALGAEFWNKSASTGLFVRPGTGERAQPPVMARVAAAGNAVLFAFSGTGSPDGAAFTIRLWPRAAFGTGTNREAEPDGEGDPAEEGQVAPEPAGNNAPQPGDAPGEDDKPRPATAGPLGPAFIIRVDGKGAVQVEGEGTSAKAVAALRPGGYSLEVSIELPEGFRPLPGDMWLASVERTAGGRGVWLLPPDEARAAPVEIPAPATPAQLFFGRSNLLDNGGFEDWQRGGPTGWALEGPEGAKAVAFPERNRVFEGRAACRVLYRKSAQVRHPRPIALRKGAHYQLRLAIWALPDPGDAPEAELAAAPHKARTFTPPQGLAVVTMPFRAEEGHAEVSLTVRGSSGAVVIDDFRLEMALPE